MGCFLKICQKWLGDGLTYDIPLPPIPCVVNRDISDSFIHRHSAVSQGRDIYLFHIRLLSSKKTREIPWLCFKFLPFSLWVCQLDFPFLF